MVRRYYPDKDSVTGPLRHSFDVTPHATNELPQITRAVMVSADGVTITGYFEGDDDPHTTVPLKAGLIYPMSFKRITGVTGGSAKGYY